MFASQEEEAYANLITSAFYLTAAADSGDKVPKVCLEVIRKKKKKIKKERKYFGFALRKFHQLTFHLFGNVLIELASCLPRKHFQIPEQKNG